MNTTSERLLISAQFRLDGMVAMMETALHLCTLIARRWNKNDVDQGSPVASHTLRPISCFRPPGTHSLDAHRCEDVGRCQGCIFAALQGLGSISNNPRTSHTQGRLDAATVSLQVKSHRSEWPLSHGIKVMPSGLFASSLLTPTGSRVARMPPVTRAL